MQECKRVQEESSKVPDEQNGHGFCDSVPLCLGCDCLLLLPIAIAYCYCLLLLPIVFFILQVLKCHRSRLHVL